MPVQPFEMQNVREQVRVLVNAKLKLHTKKVEREQRKVMGALEFSLLSSETTRRNTPSSRGRANPFSVLLPQFSSTCAYAKGACALALGRTLYVTLFLALIFQSLIRTGCLPRSAAAPSSSPLQPRHTPPTLALSGLTAAPKSQAQAMSKLIRKCFFVYETVSPT